MVGKKSAGGRKDTRKFSVKKVARKDIPAQTKSRRLDENGSSLSRMLGTLRFFSRAEPVLSAERIAELSGVPTSTAYRYVRQLTNSGLLVRWKGGFALGPRIIELDLQIRECDPAIVAGATLMRELSSRTGLDVLLSRIYGRSIMTVHIEATGSSRILNFGRGRPLPLFRGSNSKAITAFLPSARLKRLYDEARDANDPDALAQDWDAFYESMQRIRKAGYSLTKGELNSGIEGISAPIFGEGRAVIGSLTLIGDLERMSLLREEVVIDLLQSAAASLSRALN